MRLERLVSALAVILGTTPAWAQAPGWAQEYEEYPLEARIWLDRGQEPVLRRGETARLYYRVSEDAFVAIFHIDTNGTTRLVFPNSPQENHYARGGRDYRVLFPGSSYWLVNEDPGMGYFFVVASPTPFNFGDMRYSHYAGGWDLSYVGRQVYRDPYLAMDDYVAALIPDWEYTAYGLDFTTYHVDQRYEYPRFMCYDCHGFRPYSIWNPYYYSCSSFRIVIYNDPYYYPITRYRGTRVVYVQPRRGLAHFSFKERAAGEPGTPQTVVREARPRSQPGVEGTEARRAQPRGGAPSTVAVPGARPGTARGNTGDRAPGVEGTVARRPSQEGTVTQGQPRVRSVLEPPPTSATRPVLERRPTIGTGATSRTASPAPSREPARPSSRVRKGGGGAVSPPVRGGSTSESVQRGGSSGGVSGTSSVRLPTVSGRTVRSAPSATRSGGTSPPSRSTARSGGGTTSRSSAARSVSPPTRSSTVGSSRPNSSRPTAARSGGSSRATVSRPAPSRSGGSTRSAPAPSSRTPVKRRGGGGE